MFKVGHFHDFYLGFHPMEFVYPDELRLVFPTVQENASALTILPQWVEVCGRKIDQSAAVLDRGS